MARSTQASPIGKTPRTCTQIHTGFHTVIREPRLSPLGTAPFEPLWVCLTNAGCSPWEGEIFWPNWVHVKPWTTSSEGVFRGLGLGKHSGKLWGEDGDGLAWRMGWVWRQIRKARGWKCHFSISLVDFLLWTYHDKKTKYFSLTDLCHLCFCSRREGRDFCLFLSLLHPQCVEPWLKLLTCS